MGREKKRNRNLRGWGIKIRDQPISSMMGYVSYRVKSLKSLPPDVTF